MDTLRKLIKITNESKEKVKKYEELWIKIKYLNRSITKNSDYYHEKYIKSKIKIFYQTKNHMKHMKTF